MPRLNFSHLALILGMPLLVASTSVAADPPADWLERAQSQLETREYCFSEQEDGAWSAPNRAQDLRSKLAATGLELTARNEAAASWTLQVRLSAFGRDGNMTSVQPVSPTVVENRVTFDFGNIVEWYRNDSRGLKHGFDLPAAPAGQSGGGDLVLRLEVAGLCACAAQDGQAVVFGDAEGNALITYDGLVVNDATGRELTSTMRVVAGALEIVVVDSDAVYPIAVDPVFGSPNWALSGEQAGAELGARVAAAGDVNGDGFGDVIVSAPGFDNGAANAGAVFLFLGSAQGPATELAWSQEGDSADARLGESVVGVGDVNGDSFADVLLGDPRFSGDLVDQGRARLYLGSASGLGSQPSWELLGTQEGEALGEAIDTAGDVNGDTIIDVLVASPGFDSESVDDVGMVRAFAGSATGLSQAPLWTVIGTEANAGYAEQVAAAGDVNGDGYGDVLVATPRATINFVEEGQVALYLSGPTGLAFSPHWTFEGAQTSAALGTDLARAGDVNGDGFADFIVGIPLWDGVAMDCGRALLFLGTATTPRDVPTWDVEGNVASAFFGASVATAGDTNGDALADLLVGAPGVDEAYLYRGSRTGLSVDPDLTVTGNNGSSFGSSAGSAGDVNGDGFSDMIIGAPFHDDGETDEGLVQVILGQPAPPEDSPSIIIEGGVTSAQFGFVVASAGDVNGDGYGDVITGTRFFDGGVFREGGAFLYLGSPDGLSTTPVWQDRGRQNNAAFGICVSTAGDVNADGYDDFLVGCSNFDVDLTDQGRFLLYYGSPDGPNQEADLIIDGPQQKAFFGRFARTAGDVNGDGYADVIVASPEFDGELEDEGRAFLYLGSPSGLDPVAFWVRDGGQAFGRFSRPVSTAGDVNGDGYADVIVGERRFDNGNVDEGRVLVFLGDPITGLQNDPIWTFESDQNNARLGITVRTAGDVNGDGFSDIICGAYQFRNNFTNEGRAFVFHGSPTGPSIDPDWTVDSQQTRANLGWCVAPAGDVNGDGFSDVLVSALNYTETEFQGGAVFLYLGSALGLAQTAAWQASGTQEDQHLGHSIDGAADINGDGFSDVLVGATGFTGSLTREGAVQIYYGNGGLGAPRDIQQRRADDSAPLGLYSLSDSNTSFRLNTSLRSAAGRSNVGVQVEVKEFGVPFNGEGLVLGSLVDTGTPDSLGSHIGRSLLVEGLEPGILYHWRMRQLSNDPIFANSPWFSPMHNGATEADLRTAVGLAGVTSLTCAVQASGVQLDWSLPTTYTLIVVLRNGEPIATLDGLATSYLDNTPGFGTSQYAVTAFDGVIGAPSGTCSVDVLAPTISALNCSEFADSVHLTWINNFDYDALELSRNGLVLAVLAGDSDQFFDSTAPGGEIVYELTPVVEQVAAQRVSCTINHLAFPVTDLSCVRVGDAVELAWVPAVGATAIEVLRDGVLLDVLPGDAVTVQDPAPTQATHVYEVTTLVDALRSATVNCTADLTVAAVTALTCDATPTDITLTWNNSEDYQSIRVFRDSVLLATLAGSATLFVDVLPSEGVHSYEVMPSRGTLDAPAVSCSAALEGGQIYHYSAEDRALDYSSTTGVGSFTTTFKLEEDSASSGAPHELQGFSMGVAHDVARLEVSQVVMGSSLLALNGGAGPDFFQTDIVDGGVVVVSIFGLADPTAVIILSAPLTVATVSYKTVEDSFIGDNAGGNTSLAFQDGLGRGVAIQNLMVIDTISHAPEFADATIALNPSNELFMRSDCNVDGNTNLTDATFLLAAFFADGGEILCGDACDSNDDSQLDVGDVIYTLMYLFNNGTPPVAPFEECGTDSSLDSISCESYGVCVAP